MRPGLPAGCFDFCLIPEHDQPGAGKNIIVTRGAINTVQPSRAQEENRGLILVGGPSRHCHWDEQNLLEQIREILHHDRSISWHISDSRRTPPATSKALAELAGANVIFYSCRDTGGDWVARQLARAGRAWVSADSMSMIYEALTAGAATGILEVPATRPGKLAHGINTLIQDGLVTAFSGWRDGKPLRPPSCVFDEARRCAGILLKNIR